MSGGPPGARAASQRPRPALHPAFIVTAQPSLPLSTPFVSWKRARLSSVSALLLLALLFLAPPVLYRLRGAESHSALRDGPGPALGRPDDSWQSWGAQASRASPSLSTVFPDAEMQTETYVPAVGVLPVVPTIPAAELSVERLQEAVEPASRAVEVKGVTLEEPGYGAAEVREPGEGVAMRAEPAAGLPALLAAQLEAARRISPDLFSQVPATFDPAFKSPCWRSDDGLRCLPAFMLLGVFQCGVKDLFERLARHPDVAAVEAPHWWDEVHPLSLYLARFARALPAIEAAPSRAVSGDVSYATFSYTATGSQRVNVEWIKSMKECREECARTSSGDEERRACIDGGCYTRAANAYKGLRISVPQLVKAVYGEYPLRLLVMLRDPVERLHSAFFGYEHYGRKYSATEKGFSTYALEMVGHAKKCLQQHSEFDCVTGFESLDPAFEAVFFHADQVWKSVYSTFMEGWLAAFPGALLPIRLEDYAAPGGVRESLPRVIAHLGLSPLDEPALAALLEGEVRTQGEPALRARRGDMDPATRAALREFYSPFNGRLAEMLGDDRWRWGY